MRRLVALATAVLVLPGCSSMALDVSVLRITGEREHPVDVYYASPSPDGEWMLSNAADGSCVWRPGSAESQCIDPDVSLADASSAAWSPDGTRMAFTDFPFGGDPDLRVMDLDTGEITTLTEDMVGAYGLREPIPDDALVDRWPAWSEDGEHLRFVRRVDAETMELMSIPAVGGEPTRLRTIEGDIEEVRDFAWSGDTIAWIIGPDGDDGRIWVDGATTGEPTRIHEGDFAHVTISADGAYVLVVPYDEEDGPAPGAARVIPTEGGEAVPVAEGDLVRPTWSPTGHGLVYLEEPGRLLVVGEPGGEPKELRTGLRLSAVGDQVLWVPGALLVNLDGSTTLFDIDS